MEDVFSSMRNAIIRVAEKNTLKMDNEELGLKAGDTLMYQKSDIMQTLEEWSMVKNYKYYLIEHNEDENNKHWHAVLTFDSPTAFEQIKAKFPYGDIERCQYGVKNCVQYLVHMNNPEKHQYSWDEVITNAPAKLEDYKIPRGQSESEKIKDILEKIGNGELKEFEIGKIEQNLYIKFYSRIKKAFEYRQKAVILNPNRYIQVIVLQGPPRVGKSTFCKVYAKNNNKSICFSSSSNDPWQEYAGQDIFVYDDFNYTRNKIEDLLKAFDPHNLSSVSARYRNKLFVGDTIFVCTNTPIFKWYSWADDLHRIALFMRISCVLEFKDIENGISHYTVNKIVNTGEKGYMKYDNGRKEREYSLMLLKPCVEGVRKFDLNKYIDIKGDENKSEEFISQLEYI